MKTGDDSSLARTVGGWTWNLLLIALALQASRMILPKVRRQLDLGWDWMFVKPALEGVAILVLVLVLLASLGTWTWRPLPRWVRVATAAWIALTLLGCAALIIDERAPGVPVAWDRVAFFGWTMVVGTPIVLAGVGYPGLVVRLVARARRVRSSTTGATDGG